MKKNTPLVFIAIICLILFVLTACQPAEEVAITPTPTPTLPPEQKEAWEEWEGSQHADTYQPQAGADNTYCARCHSPLNWDHAATLENNVTVPEEEWHHVSCEQCHYTDGRIADAGVTWYNSYTEVYEYIDTYDELCTKCHVDEEPYFHYGRDMGDEIHQGMVCTDCHDAHDPYASCGDCHLDVLEAGALPGAQHVGLSDRSQCLECHTNGMDTHSMEVQRQGEKDCLVCHDYFANLTEDDLAPVHHSSVHSQVDCTACHDATGLEIGLVEGIEKLAPMRTVEYPNETVTQVYHSHNLTTAVDCTKCHYDGNPWGAADFAAQEEEE